jgi:hypothetical protein
MATKNRSIGKTKSSFARRKKKTTTKKKINKVKIKSIIN